ncbi:Zinc knuckle CX2CX4HX4C protein [Raphanus sativus]|nr:Zinc knuckle CX2CX4HX4C protein [Raphanus sativus]
METDMAYASGEESILTLEYERLGNHCTSCHRLSHLQSQCPERPNRLPPPPSATYIAQPSYKEDISEGPPPPRPTKEFEARENRPFQQRLDRHGRPFGNRISSTMVRPLGPKNKIAPASSAAQYLEEKEQRYRFEVQREHHYNSPPYTRRGTNILENQEEQTPTRTSNRQQTTLRWRVKSPPANQEATSPAIPVQSTRSSLGRNLDAVDFSPLYDGSNRETILEDLREASLRYINCDDPSERAARQQRVLQSELNGTVEATAAHLMQTPTRNTYGQRTSADLPPIPEIPTTEEVMEELRDATTQYLSCADPVERAARKQRVLQSELDGTVEATAANIILSSALTARTLRTADSSVIILPDTQLSTMQEPEPMAPQVTTTRKRGRPAKAKQPVPQNPSSSTAATKPTTSRSTVKLSPRTFAGMGSKKRMLARVQASPGTSNRHPPRRITQGPPATTSSTAPAIAIIPPDINLQILSSSKNFIDTIISHKGASFFATFVYGDPEVPNRKANFNPSDSVSFAAALIDSARLTNLPPLGVTGALFPWICWGLWTARNNLLFENRKFSPTEILARAIINARDWNQAQNTTTSSQSVGTTSVSLGQQRHSPCIVCFTDAAWLVTTNRAGCGWSFSIPDVHPSLQGTKTFESVSSSLMAEALAVRSALLHAREAGITEICIKTDCQALVAILLSKRLPAELYGISRDIEILSTYFSCISFIYISRTLNSVADSLAKSALYSAPIN